MKPEENRFHSRSIGGLAILWLVITFGFAAYVWQVETNKLADAVTEMRYPQ